MKIEIDIGLAYRIRDLIAGHPLGKGTIEEFERIIRYAEDIPTFERECKEAAFGGPEAYEKHLQQIRACAAQASKTLHEMVDKIDQRHALYDDDAPNPMTTPPVDIAKQRRENQ